MKLTHVEDGLPFDRKKQSRRTESRAVAVGADVLHHHLVEPRLHAFASLASLPVAPIVALDSARDSVEANLAADAIVAGHLRLGRRDDHDLLLDPVEDDVASRLRQLFPGRIEGEPERLGQAVHHGAVPGVGVVLERLAEEAAATDAAAWVGDEQFGMGQLVDAESTAGATRALGIVEDEVLGLNLAVHEMMGRAAQPAIETLTLGGTDAANDLDLEQSVSHDQRGRDRGFDRLLVLGRHDHSIDDGVHVPNGGLVEVDFGRYVNELAVDDEPPATLLADLGEHEVQLLTIDAEHWRPQLDLGPRRQRQDGFENLARRSVGRWLAGAWTVRLADSGVKQVEITRNIRHRADGRARVAADCFLLDRDDW